MIDYRHFDDAEIEPLYEFGYGLSYSTFSLQNLTIQPLSESMPSMPPASDQATPGGNAALWEDAISTSVTVSNTGVAGATVVQLYLSMPQESVPNGTPTRVLRGFEKVMLQPGESLTLQLPLKRRDVSYWDVVSQEWLIPGGDLVISVGFSSRDLQENGTVTLVPS